MQHRNQQIFDMQCAWRHASLRIMEYIEVSENTDLFCLLSLLILQFMMLPLISTHLYVFLLYLIYLGVCLMFETCQLWGMEDTCALPRQSLQSDIITPPSSPPSCQPSPDLNIWTPATGDGRLAVSLQIVPSPAAAGMNLQCLAILCFAPAPPEKGWRVTDVTSRYNSTLS